MRKKGGPEFECRRGLDHIFQLPMKSKPITTNVWVWTLLRGGVLDTILCDKVCQWLAAGQWFSPGTPVSSTNKTDRHDITEILLKVALLTISIDYNIRELNEKIHPNSRLFRVFKVRTQHHIRLHIVTRTYCNFKSYHYGIRQLRKLTKVLRGIANIWWN
jgi:hypothetical protein